MLDHDGGKYEETRRPAQRPKRYNQADVQGATIGSYQFKAGTKSAQAMLRGTECWNCTRALPLAGRGIGPCYCMECLAKKYKSVRRGLALVNKLITRKKKCKSKNASPTKQSWAKKDMSTVSSP